MNPAQNGNASGLTIACTFVSGATAGTSLIIDDYKDAVWHAGNARQVTATVNRNGANKEAGNYVVKWAGGAGLEKGPSAADVNHSIENLTSTTYDIQNISPIGAFIDAGTTIRQVLADGWVLSKPTIDGRDAKPLCGPSPGTDTNCATSLGITLTISNNVGREGNNGVTANDSNNVASAQTQATGCTTALVAPGCGTVGTGNTDADHGMHFCAVALGAECADAGSSDLGNFLSGGDLPDGAQISAVLSRNAVDLGCSSTVSQGGAPVWNWGDGDPCVSPFVGTVTAGSGLILTITPYPIPTSTRFMGGITFAGTKAGLNRVISSTSSSPIFSKFDVGMLVRGCDTSNVAGSVCAVPTGVETGTRIASVGAGGTTATMDTASGTGAAVWSTGPGQHITLGIQTKTAPATGDVVGSLAIGLIVNPSISPTSPPCAANKVSGFQLPVKWRNPGPTTPYVAGVTPPGYDWGFDGASNHFAGASISGVSTAELTALTSVTTFAGFLRQNITVASTVPTTTRWQVHFESLPIGIGLCPGTGIAETFEVKGLSNKQVINPSSTGGAFGAVRALLPETQNNAGVPAGTTYTGSVVSNTVGAHVTSGAAHTETNACRVTSPNIIGNGCQ